MVAIDPIGDAIRAAELFAEVALRDPLSAALVVVGGLLTAVSVVAFGGLSAGAALSYAARLVEPLDRRE